MSAGTGKTRTETAIGLAIALLAAAFSKFLGLYLLFMVIGVGAASLVVPRLLPQRSKGFVMSSSLQVGQLLVIAVAGLVAFGLSAVITDVVIFGAGLLWLSVKPGRGPVIYLIIAQTLGVVWNGYRLVDAFSATDWVQAVPAPTVDVIVRLLAILLLASELLAFREAQAASAQPIDAVAATTPPEDEGPVESPQAPFPGRSAAPRAPRRRSGVFAILSALLLAAALAAWPLRWESGPTETIDGTKVVHLRDRWTDQGWARLYRGTELGGELRYVPPQADLDVKKQEVLFGPRGSSKRQEYKAAMDQLDYLDRSADLYAEWIIAGRSRLLARGSLPSNAPDPRNIELVTGLGIRFPEYEAAIAVPGELITNQDILKTTLIPLVNQKEETPEKWAAQEARGELTAEAKQVQQRAVEMWSALLGAAAISTGVSLWLWLRTPSRRTLPSSASAS
ncbi:MAG: hypothetical protein ACYC5Y_05300 [Symbiobacteriia bacterium]